MVEPEYPSSYILVAELAAVCAETLALADGDAAGQAYLDELCGRYSDHHGFHQELRSVTARSPLLGPHDYQPN